jgi:hypothetical protein
MDQMKRGRLRGIGDVRGPAKHADEGAVEKFGAEVPPHDRNGVTESHHHVLTNHGYKYKGRNPTLAQMHHYAHPDGHTASHVDGITTISKPGTHGRAHIVDWDATALSEKLARTHK